HAARPPPRRVAHGADLRDPPPPGGAPPRDRAARATLDRHGAARLPPDPLPTLRLPVRLRPRRTSAGRRGGRRAGRDAGRDRAAPRLRLLPRGSRRRLGDRGRVTVGDYAASAAVSAAGR